jgi:hypothetical protein
MYLPGSMVIRIFCRKIVVYGPYLTVYGRMRTVLFYQGNDGSSLGQLICNSQLLIEYLHMHENYPRS